MAIDRNLIPFSFAMLQMHLRTFLRIIFFKSSTVFQTSAGKHIFTYITDSGDCNSFDTRIKWIFVGCFFCSILWKVIEILIIRQWRYWTITEKNVLRLNGVDTILVCIILTCCITIRVFYVVARFVFMCRWHRNDMKGGDRGGKEKEQKKHRWYCSYTLKPRSVRLGFVIPRTTISGRHIWSLGTWSICTPPYSVGFQRNL